MKPIVYITASFPGVDWTPDDYYFDRVCDGDFDAGEATGSSRRKQGKGREEHSSGTSHESRLSDRLNPHTHREVDTERKKDKHSCTRGKRHPRTHGTP